MNRVLHVIRTAGQSGAENHLVTLFGALRRLGWQGDALLFETTPDCLEPFARALTAAGGAVRRMSSPRDLSPRLAYEVRHALTSGEYDIVHSHLVHADWHAGLAALLPHRTPLVSTKHNHDPFRTRSVFRMLESQWLSRCAASIAISESLAEFVEEHHGHRPTTIRYGWPAPPEAPRRCGAVHSLLAVGRLEPQKGFDTLIHAVAIARRAGLDGLRLRIVGEGPQRKMLTAQIDRLRLRDQVELLGQRQDVRELMREADAFVHAARWEGFGLVLLEAMAAGLPIVATEVGAIPEVVEGGTTALLVPRDDPSAFAAAIVALASDPERSRRMGVMGLDRLRSEFTPDLMARRTIEVYERAMRAVP